MARRRASDGAEGVTGDGRSDDGRRSVCGRTEGKGAAGGGRKESGRRAEQRGRGWKWSGGGRWVEGRRHGGGRAEKERRLAALPRSPVLDIDAASPPLLVR
ncbi:Os12g0456866 [Oryza sativa Japonica Group]|uniref:Os12g0456866 protein n=1 Tax=Oryza sativa subsp. japonica TaxID=39947 RepID=A0A0P0Y9U3_ORYSJ|nr:Os12g0456866 [Oryza sativa Japonica Group]